MRSGLGGAELEYATLARAFMDSGCPATIEPDLHVCN